MSTRECYLPAHHDNALNSILCGYILISYIKYVWCLRESIH